MFVLTSYHAIDEDELAELANPSFIYQNDFDALVVNMVSDELFEYVRELLLDFVGQLDSDESDTKVSVLDGIGTGNGVYAEGALSAKHLTEFICKLSEHEETDDENFRCINLSLSKLCW